MITFFFLTLGFLLYNIILFKSRFEPAVIIREIWTLLFNSFIGWISTSALLYVLFNEDASCRVPPFAKGLLIIEYSAHVSRLLCYIAKTKNALHQKFGRYFRRQNSSLKSTLLFGLVHMTIFVISELYRKTCGPNLFVFLWIIPNIICMTTITLKLYFQVPWNNGDIFKISLEIKAMILISGFCKISGIVVDIVLGSASTLTNIIVCLQPILSLMITVVFPIHTIRSTQRNKSLMYASLSSGTKIQEKTLFKVHNPVSCSFLLKRNDAKISPLENEEQGTRTRARMKLEVHFQGKASFAEILQSPRSLTAAHEFAARSFASETTLFLQDAYAYRSKELQQQDNRYNDFVHIFKTYIHQSAQYPINISCKTSQEIKELAANPSAFQSLSRTSQMQVFDEALMEVEEMFWDNLLHYTSENVRKHYLIEAKAKGHGSQVLCFGPNE